MTEQTELGRFLRSRRGGVRPADVGLPAGTGVRRTPGLRREELATLAGVSIDYYTRLERGRETGSGTAMNRTDGQRIVIYMAPPGSPDHDAMTLLDLPEISSAAVPAEPVQA
jgi:Helix-turn-helix domain